MVTSFASSRVVVYGVPHDDYSQSGDQGARYRYRGTVKPISVRLGDDFAAALADEADRQGVSASSLVREGVVLRLALASAGGSRADRRGRRLTAG